MGTRVTDTSAAELSPLTCAQVRDAFSAGATWLERSADAINALNVFPVPDGDTGLNMSLTLRAAADAAAACPTDDLTATLAALSHGALMGARGNSGVILAQYLRGLARAADGYEDIDGDLLAAMLGAGSDAAYAAVAQPVEGTILSVARAAAAAAQDHAAKDAGPIAVLDAAYEAARDAVARTPDQLAILRQAGVVDSGGEGFRVVLEGLLAQLRGEPFPEHDRPIEQRADLSGYRHEDDRFGYCTEVLFRAERADVAALRQQLAELGTSVLVVGDDELMKVHVHTMRPGAALDLATNLGEIVRVKIDNMRLQFEEFTASTDAAPSAREHGTCVVAVALGDGFQEIFTSLEAIVVAGGQSMNPAVGDLVAAIERAPREHVVLLPNNRNVLLAAEQAAAATDRPVSVIPTRSMPEGIAATLAVNPDGEAETNVAAATRAIARCHTIEVTRAARATEIDGVPVAEGVWIAVLDGRLITGPSSLVGLVERALATVPADPYEVATVYIGGEGDDEAATAIRDAIATRIGIPVETQRGGQPHYAYIISLE